MTKGHWSDCATHNAPAFDPGACNCGGLDLTAYEVYRAVTGLIPTPGSLAAFVQNGVAPSPVKPEEPPRHGVAAVAATAHLPRPHDGVAILGGSDRMDFDNACEAAIGDGKALALPESIAGNVPPHKNRPFKWDRVGWSGGLAERWMRTRDRRGPLTALVLLAGYALVVLTGAMGIAQVTGLAQPVPLTPLLKGLLVANALAFVWRIAARFAFTAREYGLREGLLAVMRMPLANVIAIIAGRRAVLAYVATLGGRVAMWDKTDHDVHPAQLGLAVSGQS